MTTESAREQVRRFLDYMHPQIVDFAQESYAIQGRGAIRVEIPDLRGGSVPGPFSSSMMYQTVEELQRPESNDLTHAGGDPVALLPMVRPTNPLEHSIIVFEFPNGLPSVARMNLVTLTLEENKITRPD